MMLIHFSQCFQIRKGLEISSTYEPELDKLAQELSRTVAGESINDLFLARLTQSED